VREQIKSLGRSEAEAQESFLDASERLRRDQTMNQIPDRGGTPAKGYSAALSALPLV